jgi:hypothetical protein
MLKPLPMSTANRSRRWRPPGTRGKIAKQSLEDKGQMANNDTCAKMYEATVASKFHWDDDNFKARGQGYFVAACLDRGKPGSSLAPAATTTTVEPPNG